MKVKRNIIEINEELCDGCGQCVPACAEGALQVVDGKVKLVSEVYCDGLGACLKDCPNGAIRIIEREAEEFNEKAVEAYLEEKKRSEEKTDTSLPCGCPSSRLHPPPGCDGRAPGPAGPPRHDAEGWSMDRCWLETRSRHRSRCHHASSSVQRRQD